MAPPLLALQDVALTFGATPLFTALDMAVHARARLALVGRNGSGKSTAMKVAAGLVEADRGTRFLQPGTTIRYLPQEPDLSRYATLGDYVSEGLAEADDPYRGTYLLRSLGLDPEGGTRSLSGGEARRAALARVMAPDPDILLLDEPTNHLDLPAIEWLEAELARSRAAIVLISHDRRFLERLSRETLWIDRGRSRLLEKSFKAFEDWRDELHAAEELEAHKAERRIVREEHWVTHGVSGRRKRNVRRLGELAALRQSVKERRTPQGNVQLTMAEGQTSGKLVARVKNVGKSFGDRVLVRDFSTLVARGDRLGIVGPNGAGKTTLVRMLTGELEPDTGSVRLGANIDLLVLDQKRASLDPDWTVRHALTDGAGDTVHIGETTRNVFAYMRDFLFLPEQAGTPLHALSGGERARLTLARGLRQPSNLLVLDEPTNDLDLETLDLLQETIADYEGTVILISHDRDFLDRICTSVLLPEGADGQEGRWTEYAGGWSDMLAQRGASPFAEDDAPDKPKAKAAAPKPKPKPRAKLSFKDAHALDTLPDEIENLERLIARTNEALAAPDLFTRDPDRFAKLSAALAKAEAEKTGKEERWLELEMMREEMDA